MLRIIILILGLSLSIFASDYNATAVADELGLEYADYNLLMALTHILVGFSIMFFTIFVSIQK